MSICSIVCSFIVKEKERTLERKNSSQIRQVVNDKYRNDWLYAASLFTGDSLFSEFLISGSDKQMHKPQYVKYRIWLRQMVNRLYAYMLFTNTLDTPHVPVVAGCKNLQKGRINVRHYNESYIRYKHNNCIIKFY